MGRFRNESTVEAFRNVYKTRGGGFRGIAAFWQGLTPKLVGREGRRESARTAIRRGEDPRRGGALTCAALTFSGRVGVQGCRAAVL
jgi:hypothetical protein